MTNAGERLESRVLESLTPFLGKELQFDFSVTLSHTNKHDYKSLNVPSKKVKVPEKQDVMYPMLTNAVITADEKYALMAQANPVLAQLKESLDLQVD